MVLQSVDIRVILASPLVGWVIFQARFNGWPTVKVCPTVGLVKVTEGRVVVTEAVTVNWLLPAAGNVTVVGRRASP